MKLRDIKVGERYWTNVSGERVEVIVVHERFDHWSKRTKFLVKRADNGQHLPKFRAPSALHPIREGYWPGMMEKQD